VSIFKNMVRIEQLPCVCIRPIDVY